MGILELFLIAVSLSMDAFAVAICKGLSVKKVTLKHGLIVGLYFGGFQAGMPLLGYFLGSSFAKYIEDFDHWIAFVLLSFIGGKMVLEAFKKDDDECCCCDIGFDIKEVFMLAIATSIDALAVGITFATLKMQLAQTGFAVILIAAVTFGFSYGGVAIGNRFGARFKSKAEFAGGVILVLIGVKILLEHLGVIAF